ncbi:DUF916 and DUF3324 domain-containing protein [Periweissella cryptocerci]|uniref:DUF916 and DUF3324 domain-containing protein n=1 Tax=Periweissella cryptocerci TaxID=2506420 RepID=A0A4P6YT83_9LACO|nr:DUF916 and DUF3324 domain-containing protein [Periweissella cryptocerci]QBO35886.1 DUF916 and DUF3324 domain-containing protein [Periweissella cryptocerci]
MNKIKIIMMTVVLGMLGFVNNVGAEEVGYSVNTVPSALQQNKKLSFFDLKAKPQQTFDLKVKIENKSTEVSTFKVAATNAMTSNNGTITYGPTTRKLDQSMKVPFTSIAKVKHPKVTVPANTVKTVSMQVTMPKFEFDGMILGGFYVEKLTTEDKKTSGYSNQYAYAKGVVIKETDTVVQPDLEMPVVGIKTDNNMVNVAGTLRNASMTNIANLDMTASITKRNSDKVIVSKKVTGYSVAPTTNFDALFQYDKQKLPAGKYTFHVHANQTTGKQYKWNLQKDFVITADEVKPKESRGLAVVGQRNVLLYVLLGVVAALLVIIIFLLWFFLFYKRRKAKKDENQG